MTELNLLDRIANESANSKSSSGFVYTTPRVTQIGSTWASERGAFCRKREASCAEDDLFQDLVRMREEHGTRALTDALLHNVAACRPCSVAELYGVDGMDQDTISQFGDRILDVVRR